MGFFDKIWFKSFLFLFSLQSGVVLTIVVFATIYTGMIIMSVYTMTVLGNWNSSNIGGIMFSFIHTACIIVGISFAFLGAYNENWKRMRVAGYAMAVAFVIYVIAMLLSFIPHIYMHACVMYRCPDHIWLENSHWRTYYFENQNFVCISQQEGREDIMHAAEDDLEEPNYYSEYELNEEKRKNTFEEKQFKDGQFVNSRKNGTVLEKKPFLPGERNITENRKSQSKTAGKKSDMVTTNGTIIEENNVTKYLQDNDRNTQEYGLLPHQNGNLSGKVTDLLTVKEISESVSTPYSTQNQSDYQSSEGLSLTVKEMSESVSGPDSTQNQSEYQSSEGLSLTVKEMLESVSGPDSTQNQSERQSPGGQSLTVKEMSESVPVPESFDSLSGYTHENLRKNKLFPVYPERSAAFDKSTHTLRLLFQQYSNSGSNGTSDGFSDYFPESPLLQESSKGLPRKKPFLAETSSGCLDVACKRSFRFQSATDHSLANRSTMNTATTGIHLVHDTGYNVNLEPQSPMTINQTHFSRNGPMKRNASEIHSVMEKGNSTSSDKTPKFKSDLVKFESDEDGRVIIRYPGFGMFVSILFSLLYLVFLGYTVLIYFSFANEIRSGAFVPDYEKYENSRGSDKTKD